MERTETRTALLPTQEALTMEYLVTMTTRVPDGTSEEAIDDIRAREAAHSRELASQGYLLRLWRPPLQPGEWRSLGLFAADDGDALERVLASMPLRVWLAGRPAGEARRNLDMDVNPEATGERPGASSARSARGRATSAKRMKQKNTQHCCRLRRRSPWNTSSS